MVECAGADGYSKAAGARDAVALASDLLNCVLFSAAPAQHTRSAAEPRPGISHVSVARRTSRSEEHS